MDLQLLLSLESTPVIEGLKALFKTSGKPKQIMTDNAPTFVSVWQEGTHQFQEFLQDYRIEHCPIQPYYPQSNGKAEAAVKITKNEAIKPFMKQKPEWRAEELEELLHEFRWYYNAHRLHGGIGWTTPLTRFDPKLKITPKGLRNLFFVRKIKLEFEFC